MNHLFPITNYKYTVPVNGPASFGFKRKFDIHTGVDLYCEVGTPVFCIEPGTIVAIETFTGPNTDSPWWNETFAVLVESYDKVILYGEIQTNLSVGDRLSVGDQIGTVLEVLKKYKGKNPTSMLHIEQYKLGTKESVWWNHNNLKPDNLVDITPLLLNLIK